jgi:DNA mismatch repair protein MutS
MKAIGLSVLLAQTGSFVPAKEFEFLPFQNILTRLSGMDNMYKGQGSFSVEVNELRDICKRCTDKSLILGDELCRGTEHTSAIGIVTGGIVHMNKKNANFVLATHLHDLPKEPEILDISDSIQIKHLQVKRDPTKNTIEYIRKLVDGSGDAYYGIEVARSQGVPEDILLIAERVRKRHIGISEKLSSTKRSHFNTKKFVEYWCEVCQKNPAEHVHHIVEQHKADDNGILNQQYHKNTPHNMVGLCRNCHDDVHDRKTLEIKGYVQTSSGTKLKWKREKNELLPKLSKRRKTGLLGY